MTTKIYNNQLTNPWSNDENQILIKNYEHGDINNIYKLLPNRSKVSIQQHARKKLGLKRYVYTNTKKWSTKDQLYLVENYSTESIDILTKNLNRSWHTIQEHARQNKLTRQKDQYGKYIRHGSSKLSPLLEETPQAYYWLGYLLADGYYCAELSQIVLASAIKDLEHLQKYAKFLNTTAKTYKQKASRLNPNDSLQVRVSVADKYNAELIVKKLDWKKQKTYNPPSCKILSKTLNKKWKFIALLIGFIDGDGSINKNNFIKFENHSSYIYIFKFLRSRLLQCGINTTIPKFNKRGYVYCHINGKNSLVKLKKFILKYNLEVLNRKWDKINL